MPQAVPLVILQTVGLGLGWPLGATGQKKIFFTETYAALNHRQISNGAIPKWEKKTGESKLSSFCLSSGTNELSRNSKQLHTSTFWASCHWCSESANVPLADML